MIPLVSDRLDFQNIGPQLLFTISVFSIVATILVEGGTLGSAAHAPSAFFAKRAMKQCVEMASPVTRSDLEQLLSKAVFNQGYGLSLHSHGDGECTLAVPFRPEFLRPGGIVGGPIFMAAADVAMWLAIATRIGTEEDCVTVEMKTNFLSAAREEFRCTARVLKLGKRIVYGTAECATREGKLLTHHTLTYIRP